MTRCPDRIYEYDTKRGRFTRLADYFTDDPVRFMADAEALDDHRLVVIERDGGRGATAIARPVYAVDLAAAGGSTTKNLVVELAAIPDPDLVSLPAIHNGDIGLGDPFQVTCESIEAVHVISGSKLLFGCDNNFPNPAATRTGRRQRVHRGQGSRLSNVSTVTDVCHRLCRGCRVLWLHRRRCG